MRASINTHFCPGATIFLIYHLLYFCKQYIVHNIFQILTYDMKMIQNAFSKFYIWLDVRKSKKIEIVPVRWFLNFDFFSFCKANVKSKIAFKSAHLVWKWFQMHFSNIEQDWTWEKQINWNCPGATFFEFLTFFLSKFFKKNSTGSV